MRFRSVEFFSFFFLRLPSFENLNVCLNDFSLLPPLHNSCYQWLICERKLNSLKSSLFTLFIFILSLTLCMGICGGFAVGNMKILRFMHANFSTLENWKFHQYFILKISVGNKQIKLKIVDLLNWAEIRSFERSRAQQGWVNKNEGIISFNDCKDL